MRRLDTFLVISLTLVVFGFGAGMAATVQLAQIATPVIGPRLTEPPPRMLVEGSVGPVGTLDPLFASMPAERSITALLFRGLVRLGAGDSIEPDLATDWDEESDGATYTFRLRTDVKWHDGVLVSADDVVTTFAALTDPAFDGPAAGDWDGVSVERVDRFTVRFHLAEPLGGFLVAMTQPLIPAHLLAGLPNAALRSDRFGLAPIGNGPFSFLRMTSHDVLLARVGPRVGGVQTPYAPDLLALVPEPTPHGAIRPRTWFDLYRMRLYDDRSAVADALEAGLIDVAADLAPAAVATLQGDHAHRVLRYPGSHLIALIPNLRFDSGPLRPAGVRRALSSAIDRDTIVQEVFAGGAVPVRTPIAPASFAFDPQQSGTPIFDPEGARIGLTGAGWTQSADGWHAPDIIEPVQLELLVRDAPSDPLGGIIADRVAADWRAIGLAVTVAALPPDELVSERLRPGDFDIVLLDIDLGLDPDLYPLLFSGEAFVGGTNIAGFQSSVIDWLLQDARVDAPEATRVERFRSLQAALAREMPMVPLLFPDEVFVVDADLVGPTSRQLGSAEDRYWDVLAWRLASGLDE